MSSEQISIDVLDAQLKGRGFVVRGARSLRDVMQELRGQLPDVVLTDLRLSVESGLAVLQHLRSSEETSSLPVIVVAPEDHSRRHTAIVDAVRLGANDVISRPVDVRLLREKLLMLVHMREMAAKRLQTVRMLTGNFSEPVQTIRGLVGLLLREHFGPAPSPQAIKAIEAIDAANEQLAKQNRELLDFLRPDNERTELDLCEADLADLVRKASQRAPVPVALRSQGASSVQCDGPELERAIAHLLGTMAEFLPRRDGEVAAAVRTDNGSAVITFEFPRAALSRQELMLVVRHLLRPMDSQPEESGRRLSFMDIVVDSHAGTMKFGGVRTLELELALPVRTGKV